MTISRENKTLILSELKDKLKNSECVLLAHYSGVNVQDLENFRKLSRNSGVEVKVIKNSLFRLALKGSSFTSLSEHSSGPTIYGFGEDPVSVSKVFNEFSKKNDSFKVTSGAITDQLLSNNEIKILADLPPREELLSKLVSTMAAPISKFVSTLNAVPMKLLLTLTAMEKK